VAPLCSREETREAIVETLNEVGWRYSMRGADTYAAEIEWRTRETCDSAILESA
jgi:hypothetical protein